MIFKICSFLTLVLALSSLDAVTGLIGNVTLYPEKLEGSNKTAECGNPITKESIFAFVSPELFPKNCVNNLLVFYFYFKDTDTNSSYTVSLGGVSTNRSAGVYDLQLTERAAPPGRNDAYYENVIWAFQ